MNEYTIYTPSPGLIRKSIKCDLETLKQNLIDGAEYIAGFYREIDFKIVDGVAVEKSDDERDQVTIGE